MLTVMKFFRDHSKLIGIATLDGGTFEVVADTPDGERFIKDTLAHHHVRLLDATGKEPTNEQVATEVAAHMPEGKRTWCQLVSAFLP